MKQLAGTNVVLPPVTVVVNGHCSYHVYVRTLHKNNTESNSNSVAFGLSCLQGFGFFWGGGRVSKLMHLQAKNTHH